MGCNSKGLQDIVTILMSRCRFLGSRITMEQLLNRSNNKLNNLLEKNLIYEKGSDEY